MARTEFLVEHTTDEMFEFKTAIVFLVINTEIAIQYAQTCGVRNLLSVGLNFFPLCLHKAVVDFQMILALYFRTSLPCKSTCVSFNKFITCPMTFWKVVKLTLTG